MIKPSSISFPKDFCIAITFGGKEEYLSNYRISVKTNFRKVNL